MHKRSNPYATKFSNIQREQQQRYVFSLKSRNARPTSGEKPKEAKTAFIRRYHED